MAKYIDSDKLKELIDEKWKELANNDLKVGGRGKWDSEINTYLSVLKLIDFLQQAQSNNNLEEKAEAYDKAIKRAKAAIDVAADKDLVKGVAITILPELCESEDEKIRKELLAVMNDLVLPNEQKARFNTWLERQKDADKAIEAVEKIDKYIDEHLANAHDMKDSNPDKKYYRGWDDALGEMSRILQDVYSGEKQKEQKPVENSTRTKIINRAVNEKQVVLLSESNGNAEIDWDTRSLEDAKKLLEHGIVFINERLGTKSAEWSKEDEKHKQAIIDAIQIVMEECGDAESIEKYKDDIDWFENRFKSLRSQLKQEYSEEDKKKIERLRSVVNQLASYTDSLDVNGDYCEGDYAELDDWLKSLRPQPHTVSIKDATKFGNLEYERGVKDGIQSEKSHQWKPSEQEKIALRTAICVLTEENCPKTVANLQAILDVFDDKESRKDWNDQ